MHRWKEQPDNLRKAGTNAIEQLREYVEVSSLAGL